MVVVVCSTWTVVVGADVTEGEGVGAVVVVIGAVVDEVGLIDEVVVLDGVTSVVVVSTGVDVDDVLEVEDVEDVVIVSAGEARATNETIPTSATISITPISRPYMFLNVFSPIPFG